MSFSHSAALRARMNPAMNDLFARQHGHAPVRRPKYSKPFKPVLFDLAKDKTDAERKEIADAMRSRALDLLTHREAERIGFEAERYEACRRRRGKYECRPCAIEYSFHRFCHSRICETCGRIFKERLTKQLIPLIESVYAQKKKGYFLGSLTLTLNKARFGDAMPTRSDIARFHKESAKMLKLFFGKYIVKERPNGNLYEPAPRWIYRRDPVSGKKIKHKRRAPSMVKTRKGTMREDYRYWKGAGSIVCLEVGKDNNNLHLHAIVYGPLVDIDRFRLKWSEITGDSTSTWLVPITGRTVYGQGKKPIQLSFRDSIGHLLKYITKPPASDSNIRIADFAIMLKGSRRLKTSGIFYDRIKMAPPLREAKNCLRCHGELRFVSECDLSQIGSAVDYQAASDDPSLIEARTGFRDFIFVDFDNIHSLPI